jgi:poly-gamma-glutamate synthesis protein (capsule biosynthesis protein)
VEAHQLIMAGADVIVCHHTHTLQTIEEFRGKKIYYSIGNFIFDQAKPLNSRACMVRLNIKRDGFTVETVPIEILHCVPWVQTAL